MRPDNYEITYIMHNQQPWVKRSDKTALAKIIFYLAFQAVRGCQLAFPAGYRHSLDHHEYHVCVPLEFSGEFRCRQLSGLDPELVVELQDPFVTQHRWTNDGEAP